MGIYSALNVGVSGLQAQSNKLSVISDNIANVNTVGYKQAEASFENLMLRSTPSDYSPGGVVGGNRKMNDLQGEILGTRSNTDIAIAGSGFFPVSAAALSGGGILYTRAGSFVPDTDGNFINSAGFFLQGWRLSSTGALAAAVSVADPSSSDAIANLTTVNVAAITALPVATTNVALHANLDAVQTAWPGPPAYGATIPAQNMAAGSVPPQFSHVVTVIDSEGASHTLNVAFLKTAINNWAVEIYAQPAADVTVANGQIANGTLTFNGDGTLAAVSASLSQPLPITWTAPDTDPSTLTFNWGTAGVPFGTPLATVIGRADGMSQFGGGYNTRSIEQDGVAGGTLERISISENGTLSGIYSDGSTHDLYKIPVVQFIDPDQLELLSGNVFLPTANTSTPNFHQAGTSGTGKIASSALELSNVELSSQLTEMIIAQRAYQANTKIVSTSDTLLDDLDRMLG